MGLSRRFLNVIVNEHRPTIANKHRPGLTSLRCIDLGRHQLFYPPGTLPPAALKVEELSLPAPTFSFRASRRGCLPVADRKVLCTDRCNRAFLFDAATQHVVTIPIRRTVMSEAVSVFVPRGGDSDGDGDPDGTLFVMEKWPKHEKLEKNCTGPESEQYEAFVYRRTSMSSPAKSWHCQLLPPLPCIRIPKYRPARTMITSYAVVGGGSHICVSVGISYVYGGLGAVNYRKNGVGTYCLDTVIDRAMREPRLAYRGSGRFCITRFFADGHHLSRERFAVLTGVEVTPQAHGGSRDDGGEAKLQMIRHKSRLVPSDTCVDAVF